MIPSDDICASSGLDEYSRDLLHRLAMAWKNSPARPRVRAEVLAHWDGLVDSWVVDARMPLLVRKSGHVGEHIAHPSGRTVVCTDNSPANWCLSCALSGLRPELDDILAELQGHRLPVGMVVKFMGLYSGSLRGMSMPNLNELGWKVCHVEPVGRYERKPIAEIPLEQLASYTWRLISPRNMFVVPKRYSGLGELPEFTEAFRSDRNP